MKNILFKSLLPGSRVRLNHPATVYGSFFDMKDGSTRREMMMPAGSIGTVSTFKVPSVRRKNAYFYCVDFAPDTLPEVKNPHQNIYRIAIHSAEDAELISTPPVGALIA